MGNSHIRDAVLNYCTPETTDSCGVNSASSDTHPIPPFNADQTSITQRHDTYTKAYTDFPVLHQIKFTFVWDNGPKRVRKGLQPVAAGP